MRFDFRPIDNLPRLAWCAYLTKGEDSIVVRHGPWVETRDDCFFEGAWNGPFAEGRFDIADTFTGTGARLTRHGVTFVAPTHPVQRIYSVRIGCRLIVSNSWTFLLVAIGDQPDIGYADYYFDLQRNFRDYWHIPTVLRTQNGNAVSLIDVRNMSVTAELDVQYATKQRAAEPQTYAQYVDLLQTTTDRIVENAAHPARRQHYRPVTMISTGYDSTAASTLASRSGCIKAVTFAWLYRDGQETGDDGSDNAQSLGLAAERFGRFEYVSRTDCVEAEFCSAGPQTWAPVSAMETTLVGSLLITGTVGYVRQEQFCKIPPYSVASFGAPVFPFTGITEFRLRAGFLVFPALNAGVVHENATRRITRSQEMRPWVLPDTSYNKPILRRLVEEAGIPRSQFGQPYRANAFANLAHSKMFSLTSQEDFTAYCRNNHLPLARDNRWYTRWIARISRGAVKGASILLARLPVALSMRLYPYIWRLYHKSSDSLWRSPALYTFHWGFERTKQRYQIGSAE